MKVRIYKELFKQSIEEFMIYRMTASLTVLFGIMFYGIELLAGVVYFQYTDSIMGLTRTDYMILITTANIIQMGYQFLFVASHEMLEETIIEGGLDYALIRPVNSFFYYSFQRIDIASAIGVLFHAWIKFNRIINFGLCYRRINGRMVSFFNQSEYCNALILG